MKTISSTLQSFFFLRLNMKFIILPGTQYMTVIIVLQEENINLLLQLGKVQKIPCTDKYTHSY